MVGAQLFFLYYSTGDNSTPVWFVDTIPNKGVWSTPRGGGELTPVCNSGSISNWQDNSCLMWHISKYTSTLLRPIRCHWLRTEKDGLQPKIKIEIRKLPKVMNSIYRQCNYCIHEYWACDTIHKSLAHSPKSLDTHTERNVPSYRCVGLRIKESDVSSYFMFIQLPFFWVVSTRATSFSWFTNSSTVTVERRCCCVAQQRKRTIQKLV